MANEMTSWPNDWAIKQRRTQMATKQKISKREWIDSTGAAVETEESATGFRYSLVNGDGKPTGESVERQLGAAGTESTMYAIFGALTLMGNVLSGAKNDDNPFDAVQARLNLIAGDDENPPRWVDRTGTQGPKYDQTVLSQAIAQIKGGDAAAYLAKMSTEVMLGGKKVPYAAAAMRHDEVKKAYYAIKPAKVAEAPTLDVL